MTAPLSNLQSAVYDRLITNAPLTALLAAGTASILDHVPAGTEFPYVALGEMTQTALRTQNGTSHDIHLNIHSYSRYYGFAEIQNIMAAIAAALENADFPVDAYQLVLCQSLEAATLLESDGATRHGILRFRIILDPL